MRNIFGYNQTQTEEAPVDGQVFLRATVPEYHRQQLKQHVEAMNCIVKKLVFWPHILLEFILGIPGFGLLFISRYAQGALSYTLLVIGIVCLAGMFLVIYLDSLRSKSILESTEFDTLKANAKSLSNTSRILLDIPAETADLDVLIFPYKVKNGRKKPADKNQDYTNLPMSAWVENAELILADDAEKFAIPLSSITAVRRRKGKVKVFMWKKDDAPKSPTYKPYKIKYEADRNIFALRAVYALEIAHDGEMYQLLVPEYDWDLVLEPLIGSCVPDPVMG